METTVEAATTIRAAQTSVRAVLIDDPGSAVCDSCTAQERRSRQFPVTMAIDTGHGAGVHKTVLLHFGAPRSSPEGALVLPITWRAGGHERLFPTFAGELEALEDRGSTLLRLKGTYTVPLGVIGRFGDGVAGRRLARRSLGSLADQIARRLESEVARRLEDVAWEPTPHPVTVREDQHSEIYLG